MAYLLPAREAPASLSQNDIAFLAGMQQVIRNQDLLQTRLRALQALLSLDDNPLRNSHGEHRPSKLSEVQAQELKRWLGQILEIAAEGEAADEEELPKEVKKEESPEVEVKREPDAVNQVKEEEEEDKPVKLEQLEEKFNPVLLKAARPEAIILPPQNGASLSPPMSSTSSSSSTGLETPTPAMNRPQGFDLFAPAVQEALISESKTDSHAPVVETLASSLRELEIGGSDRSDAAPLLELSWPPAIAPAQKHAPLHVNGHIDDLGSVPPAEGQADERSPASTVEMHIEHASPRQELTPLQQQSARGVNGRDSNGTPYTEAKDHLDSNGWTTVVSKKHKIRS